MRIIFMGTPEFAVPSLDILVRSGYEVVAVITATDKMGGRGNKTLLESAVKQYAVKKNLLVLQPKNLKNEAFQASLKALKADLQIVVAFRMLPEAVWNMPPLGTLNLHGSLLPKYRGAAPINWAVINGDKETGLTTFKLKHEIDTGELIHQSSIPIHDLDTAGTIHDKLMHLGPELILRTVQDIQNDTVSYSPQDETLVSKAPKIFHQDCAIDLNQPGIAVFNFIRGMSPYPAGWIMVEESKKLKIFRTKLGEKLDAKEKVGDQQSDFKTYWNIASKDCWISLEEVQLTGKKRMKIKEFLNGYKPDLKNLLEN